MEAEEGSDVRIPCLQFKSVMPPGQIRAVLWFKENDTKPIKSVDGRRHWRIPPKILRASPETPARAVQRPTRPVAEADAVLHLTGVEVRHSGRYRCRVDATDTPTVVSWVRLVVKQAPPTPTLKVYNRYGAVLGHTALVVIENTTMVLICQSERFGAEWKIVWSIRRWGNAEEILPSEEINSQQYLRAQLKYTASREDNGAKLVCTIDSRISGTTSSAVVDINISYGPDSATLICEPHTVHEGDKFVCRCFPEPQMDSYEVTWEMDGRHITPETSHMHHMTSAQQRLRLPLTSSRQQHLHLTSKRHHQLQMTSSSNHDGSTVTCRVKNNVTGRELRANATLSVFYRPTVVLSGPSASLSEGASAHFFCFVRANPAARVIQWLRNREPLMSSDRAITGPRLLILHRITHEDIGPYSCFANNSLGGATSNVIQLQIDHAPVCISKEHGPQKVLLHRSAFFTCRVKSRPAPVTFRWWLVPTNGSEKRLDAVSHDDHGFSSALRWAPSKPSDYGFLLCRASNQHGTQRSPCRFKILPPDAPSPPRSCSVSIRDGRIVCLPGDNSDLPANYTLRLFQGQHSLANWTQNLPNFSIPLGNASDAYYHAAIVAETAASDAHYHAAIFAETAAGTSEVVILQLRPRASTASPTGIRRFPVNSWVLAGAIAGLVGVIALLVLSVYVRCHCISSSAAQSRKNSADINMQNVEPIFYTSEEPIYAEVVKRADSLPPRPRHKRLPTTPANMDSGFLMDQSRSGADLQRPSSLQVSHHRSCQLGRPGQESEDRWFRPVKTETVV